MGKNERQAVLIALSDFLGPLLSLAVAPGQSSRKAGLLFSKLSRGSIDL